MQLVERHIINKNHSLFKDCDDICFSSKNLYNKANYIIRNHFVTNGKYFNYYDINKIMITTNDPDYINMPRKVSNQTLRLLDKNWLSFFRSIKDYKKHPHKYKGRPKLPKYKDKTKGRYIVYYEKGAISKKELNNNYIVLSQANIKIKTKVKYDQLVGCRIIPNNNHYVIEVIYKKEVKQKKENNNIMGIDLGLNNLSMCVLTNTSNKVVINGKPVKSINQYYNKTKARLQKVLSKNQYSSKKIIKMANKRNNKINDYMHKSSRYIIDYCLTNDISKIIIGKNKDWKQEINLGKKNNQSFVSIPYNKLINMIRYKGELEGIEVLEVEESYTSKSSFIDNDKMGKECSGKRITRGMYKTRDGYLINADVNGAYNIIRKVVPQVNVNTFMYGIEDIAVYPSMISL